MQLKMLLVTLLLLLFLLTLTSAWYEDAWDEFKEKWKDSKMKEVKIIKKVKYAKGPGLKFKVKCWYDEMKAKMGAGCGCGLCRRRRRRR